ncbi:GNAT family N-acetyltransferase [Lacisediminihabitans changchengi]|uniref:GNAT family N-acetyltransferase n=1 Tax=Lacisediminihabitans changchengi TaxID=2787634 RepID=A0A934VXY5_9MICO|nr:GNAT family N-acetyltransferase [Lacisediminihabitans changchengi]MBK4347432.1 GNAT family N-acetyltransferase [Lacisediminihabitans changchengi]
MSDATWTVRPATVDDIEAIVDLRIAGWRVAYAHVMSADFLDRLAARRDVEAARRRARFDDPSTRQIVGECDGRIVGWGMAGPSTDDDAPAAQELYALYVHPELHGSGLASALLEAVIGRNPASLWVLGANPRARAFYSREGFVADGASKMLDGELSHIPEIRMVRLAS